MHETKTNDFYDLANDVTVVVEYNKTKEIIVQNEKKKGQVKVVKFDKDYNEIKLKDVEFDVLDEKGNVVDKLKTDEKGEATSKLLPIDQKYTIKETITDNLYELNETPITIVLEEKQIKTLTVENKHKEGNIKVYKVDKDNNKIALGAIEFELYSEEFQKVIGTYKTDSNGEIFIPNLRIRKL